MSRNTCMSVALLEVDFFYARCERMNPVAQINSKFNYIGTRTGIISVQFSSNRYQYEKK